MAHFALAGRLVLEAVHALAVVAADVADAVLVAVAAGAAGDVPDKVRAAAGGGVVELVGADS